MTSVGPWKLALRSVGEAPGQKQGRGALLAKLGFGACAKQEVTSGFSVSTAEALTGGRCCVLSSGLISTYGAVAGRGGEGGGRTGEGIEQEFPLPEEQVQVWLALPATS